MIFYTNVHCRGNYIYLRGFKDNKRISQKIPFEPSFYTRTNKSSQYKTIKGENLERIKFKSILEARDFVTKYKQAENFQIYGNMNYVYQFISKLFPNPIDFDMSLMKIVTIDIETSTEYGFPDPRTAQEEILLISVQDFNTKKILSFGCKPYLAENPNVTYIQCADEFELLRKFIDALKKDYPDIITGWNVQLFDISYLSTRILKVLGEKALDECSPHRHITQFEVPYAKGRTQLAYNWLGISVLDYMDLYKKFSYKVQESYALDFIAKEELGKQKIKHGYGSFKEFYSKDWKLFVDYNINDVELVDQLEEKMSLINLILTMAYDAKCNFMDIYSSVRTWDCIIFNALLKDNIIVRNPEPLDPSLDRQIMGAFVKEPKPGKYDWVVSFDATSLYPSIMMSFNMSPETLIDGEKYLADDEKSIVKLINKEFNTDKLKEKNVTMVANGQCFRKDVKGILPRLIEYYFGMRQKVKKQMIDYQKLYEETKDEKFLKHVTALNSKQMAAKILMNSLYGACGNVYFRFYDIRLAEGITMTGQYIIRSVANKLNNYLNNQCDTKNIDYSFYSDTDSTYLTLGKLVEKFFNKKTPLEKVELIDKACEENLSKIIDSVCNDIFVYLNVYQKKISFKREIIADSGIWLAKKRYALNVYNSEGIVYDQPKLKVQGMEIVRSSTPASVRSALKDSVGIVLRESEESLKKFVSKLEERWSKLDYQDIAFPRTVNGVGKYKDENNIFKKGTPIHVRGALIYNFLIQSKNLDKKYQYILEGDRIKFLYLREPNPLGTNVITFTHIIPPEFNIDEYIDYEMMFEKAFLDPLNSLLDSVGWKLKEQASLEGLFG